MLALLLLIGTVACPVALFCRNVLAPGSSVSPLVPIVQNSSIEATSFPACHASDGRLHLDDPLEAVQAQQDIGISHEASTDLVVASSINDQVLSPSFRMFFMYVSIGLNVLLAAKLIQATKCMTKVPTGLAVLWLGVVTSWSYCCLYQQNFVKSYLTSLFVASCLSLISILCIYIVKRLGSDTNPPPISLNMRATSFPMLSGLCEYSIATRITHDQLTAQLRHEKGPETTLLSLLRKRVRQLERLGQAHVRILEASVSGGTFNALDSAAANSIYYWAVKFQLLEIYVFQDHSKLDVFSQLQPRIKKLEDFVKWTSLPDLDWIISFRSFSKSLSSPEDDYVVMKAIKIIEALVSSLYKHPHEFFEALQALLRLLKACTPRGSSWWPSQAASARKLLSTWFNTFLRYYLLPMHMYQLRLIVRYAHLETHQSACLRNLNVMLLFFDADERRDIEARMISYRTIDAID